jgi:hypothetical protein
MPHAWVGKLLLKERMLSITSDIVRHLIMGDANPSGLDASD